MKRAVIISTALMLALCAGPFALAQSADPNIEAITFTNGKSNLKEKVYDSKAPCLVFFWDSNYFKGDEGFENEWAVFKALAEKHKGTGIGFYSYDISREKGYNPNGGYRGIESANENVGWVPSVAMYNKGKQIDIRQGGTKAEYIKANLENCDIWIRVNLTNEFMNEPTTYKYSNSFDLKEVPR